MLTNFKPNHLKYLTILIYVFSMIRYLKSKEYKTIKERKTPFIIYFRKENLEYCTNVVKTLEKLSESFPLVFCYIVTPRRFPVRIGDDCCTLENVYSFQDKTIDKEVVGTSYSELFELFRHVYRGSFISLTGFLKLVKMEIGRNINTNFIFNKEPNYRNIAKYHRYEIREKVRHKYTEKELKFLSSLSDCKMKNCVNYDPNHSIGFLGGNKSPVNHVRCEKYPIFPDSEIIFRPPTPYIVQPHKLKKVRKSKKKII